MLLGSVATSIAVIAVAAIGLMMLGGRVELRKGAAVVIGCFVVFGASTIVAGIQSAARGYTEADGFVVAGPPPFASAPRQMAPAIPAASDPYAGASVPQNR
jgi:hypothetical protein